ncbi:Serine/threonine-protein phosphatase 2A activator [Trichostrongylus colubriformis]|uniref:Serine/threonine-protein phosphatase 2A activator n=1 Tax=Trichostrongylus colubriformis TaxID=6319 RepID=A0AAN8INS7_TRICO
MIRACVKETTFIEPEVRITSIFRVHPFTFTEGYRYLTAFIRDLNEAVIGIRTSDDVLVPTSSSSLLRLLDILTGWLNDFPQGNSGEEDGDDPAFRQWHSMLHKNLSSLLEDLLRPEFYPAIVELSAYLIDSFGRPEENDYGVGNEASFLIFLMCLYRIGFLESDDKKAIVLRVFDRYLKLCRTLQQMYHMRPAIVAQFAIDDYHFMPYVWGSAQLIENRANLVPESYADRTTVEKFAKDYLVFDAIHYIFQIKKGEFHEHSQELWNITAIHAWDRMNRGLLRMYEAEVLQKFSVVRRFRFGALFSFERRDDVPQEGGYVTDEDSDLND